MARADVLLREEPDEEEDDEEEHDGGEEDDDGGRRLLGVGFNRKTAKTSRGLGINNMEERLKLAKGTLSIASQPKGGTTIHARVPLSLGSDSTRAVGRLA